jgi:hypothetical protein
MQQPGILQPAKADSPSIGHRRFSETCTTDDACTKLRLQESWLSTSMSTKLMDKAKEAQDKAKAE